MTVNVAENVNGDFKINRIAIIGAGAAGLAAATYVSVTEIQNPQTEC
jgi:cation diffusion facilitator CzcD-associated flavoprotein CzcO